MPRPTFVGSQRGDEDLHHAVVSWVTSEPLADLVALEGHVMPGSSVADNLRWLSAFSASHWDFRGGRERHAIGPDRRPTPPVLDALTALGLRGSSSPARREYTHVLILGGLASACYQRAHFARELLNDGVRTKTVTALCGDRALHASEHSAIAAAGLEPVDDEEGVLDAALRSAFDGAPGISPTLLVAPPTDSRQRRANTVDTYRWWGLEATDLSRADSVLVVTTDIYVPYQACDAIRVLGLEFGCEIDVVGVDRASAAGPIGGRVWSLAQYLQETRSMILSTQRLLAELERPTPR